MTASGTRTTVLAWLALVLVSVGSLLLGTDRGLHDHNVVAAILLAVAFAKVLVVGLEFMELSHAAPLLRRAFCGYVLVVGLTLVGLAVAL